MKKGGFIDSYARALAYAMVAGVLQWSLYRLVGSRVPFLFFLPAMVVAASTLGRGPAWLVLLCGALNDMLMAAPVAKLAMADSEDQIALLAYLMLGVPLAAYGARVRLISLRASEAEQRLSLVQREAGIGLFELDYAAGTAYVSPSLCRILEQPVTDGPLPLDRWLQMLQQDHVSESNEVVQQRLRDGIHNYQREQRVNLPSGEARWLLSHIQLKVGNDGALVSARGATIDITPRKQLELALNSSQAELKRRVEELDCLHQCSIRLLGVTELKDQLALILDTVVDFQGAAKGLLTLRETDDAQPRIAAHRGFSPASLAVIPALACHNPVVQEAYRSGRPLVLEDIENDPRFEAHLALTQREGIRSAHGTPLIGSNGDVLGMLTVHFAKPHPANERDTRLAEISAQIATNLVERAQVMAEAARIDRQFRVALESSAVAFDILLAVRDETGRIVDFRFDYVNAEGLRALQLPREKILGRTVSEVIPDVWAEPGLLARHSEVIETGKGTEFELRQVRNGLEVWLHVAISPLQESIAVWFTDITERKRNEQMLVEADRRKDEFVATLAHELRNPLAPILHAAAISRADHATPDQRRWGHEVIERQVRHMGLMLDDLLDVSRITRGALQLRKGRVELNSVVAAGVEIARPLIEARQHTLILELSPQRIVVDADLLRLAQVMGNLLTNAAKYTDPGGRIVLRTGEEQGQAWITISDNGVGIAPETLHGIFRMFNQVTTSDVRSGGLGIGLALARGLMTLHDGSIEAHSEGIGKGSRFTVRLPVDKEIIDPRSEQSPAEVPLAARRILVADDNRDAAEAIAMLLELDGHEVTIAFDGEAALANFLSTAPDIVMLDIGMPKLTGFEVSRRIRQAPKQPAKLIAISGWGLDSDKRHALEAGFDHHVTKPIDIQTLRDLIAA
jgi:PAS domain S-box-containing protein